MNEGGRHRALLGLILLATIALAYGNTFQVPFLFDDQLNILENESIRSLWPPWSAFTVPSETGIVGRPIVNYSLAVNYALSGTKVWSYHLVNLIIHLLAVLTLFSLLREAKAQLHESREARIKVSFFFAACVWLWGIHPLLTQAVTYIIQRCESAMALFTLLTFYCALRGWRVQQQSWHWAALLSFLLAMGCKESAVVAPFILLAYEWTSRGTPPVRAMRASPLLYGGLAVIALLGGLSTLAAGVWVTRTDNSRVDLISYWLNQCPVILHYLKLASWPFNLTFDYGWQAAPVGKIWPDVLTILALVGLSLWGLVRRSVAGFGGTCFFLLLAPTSLFPLKDLAFEQRMYLPLAVLVLMAGNVVRTSCRRLSVTAARMMPAGSRRSGLALALLLALGLGLGTLTYLRNRDYQSEAAIWTDTLHKRPNHFRAYQGLAMAMSRQGRHAEALALLKMAQRLNPRDAYVQNDTGFILYQMGKPAEAVPYFQEAIRLKPTHAKAYNNLGAALASIGRSKEAEHCFLTALNLRRDYPLALKNLGLLLSEKRKAEGEGLHNR